MNFSIHDFIHQDEILSDVMIFTGEKRLETVSKGFIYSQMNKCLEELSFDLFASETSIPMDIPSNRILDIPAGVFNIKEVYAYSGDSCTIDNSEVVYWKRNYYHTGGAKSVSRNNERANNDPFHENPVSDRRIRATSPNDLYYGEEISKSKYLYYYGYQNGRLYLSPNVAKFNKILIKFNGILGVDVSKPSIPRHFRKVVTDYAKLKVLEVKKVEAKDINRWRMLWADVDRELDRNGYNGSWYNAESRMKRMSTKERQDLNEYLSRLNY